jgi:hypothetical protein
MNTKHIEHAFPFAYQTGFSKGVPNWIVNHGMTLRDWFAGMALRGLATNQEMLLSNKELLDHFGTSGIDELQANKAYRLADAMLTERSK